MLPTSKEHTGVFPQPPILALGQLTLCRSESHAVRIVTDSSYDAPADALIQKLKWPTIAEIIKRETATIVYKFIYDLVPAHLSNIFSIKTSFRASLNLRKKDDRLLSNSNPMPVHRPLLWHTRDRALPAQCATQHFIVCDIYL